MYRKRQQLQNNGKLVFSGREPPLLRCATSEAVRLRGNQGTHVKWMVWKTRALQRPLQLDVSCSFIIAWTCSHQSSSEVMGTENSLTQHPRAALLFGTIHDGHGNEARE